jgi:hypothetical protein
MPCGPHLISLSPTASRPTGSCSSWSVHLPAESPPSAISARLIRAEPPDRALPLLLPFVPSLACVGSPPSSRAAPPATAQPAATCLLLSSPLLLLYSPFNSVQILRFSSPIPINSVTNLPLLSSIKSELLSLLASVVLTHQIFARMRSVCYFVVASSFVLAIDANSVPLTTPTAVPSSPEPSAPESPRAATQPAGLIVESRPALICCGQEDNKVEEDLNFLQTTPESMLNRKTNHRDILFCPFGV